MTKQGDLLKKFIGFLLVVIVIVYLGYQIIGGFVSRVDTEQAVTYEATENVLSEGYLARQELLLPSNGATVEILAQNGAMVSAGQKLAAYYSNESDAAVRQMVLELEEEIGELKSITGGDGASANLSGAEKDISETIYSLSRTVSEGKTYKAYDIKQRLETLFAKVRAVDAGISGVESKINELTAEKNRLASQIKGTVTYEYAPKPGYFSSVVDGYEGILTPEYTETLTASQYSDLGVRPQIFQSEYIGKLITGYKWYLVTVLSRDYEGKLSVGKKVDVKFTGSASYDIPGIIKKINYEKGDAEAVYVLEFDRFPEDILLLRNQNIEIVIRKVEGLRVPKSAMRIVDGVKGVYCLVGAQAKFKKISIVYEGANYYLVKQGTGENDLLVMDDIIVNGKNLYDGKMVK